MQTFLPYPDYRRSLECLDPKRLGNQVYREAPTLLNGGWRNHPAARMWHGYEYQLALYGLAGCGVLSSRSRPYPKWVGYYLKQLKRHPASPVPPWLGDNRLHSSHRANLLRKNPDWYGKFGWDELPAEGYWWPV